MPKVFNVTAICIPEEHYMVNLDKRLREIKVLVDEGKYFTINKARQYGKTTTLMALEQYLKPQYYVVSMDFQMFDTANFQEGRIFAVSFADSFLKLMKRNRPLMNDDLKESIISLKEDIDNKNAYFTIKKLFEKLSDICSAADKPIVLMIDEVDSAANHKVFLDFLAQLRAYYIRRSTQPIFQSVILAGVYDIKNLKRRFRQDEEHKVNSPWNIAAEFNIEMSFSKDEIAGMLWEYEKDYHTGMDIDEMSSLLYDYTSGYPFLVSRLCKLIDEQVSMLQKFQTKSAAWAKDGFFEAVRMILTEKNTLFESLIGKLADYPELDAMLYSLLFTGKSIVYNVDEPAIDMATMFGFIKNEQGMAVVANRIFETRLYNRYLSAAEMQRNGIYKAALQDKSQFITNGRLNMKLLLEKFAVHFNDLYGDNDNTFVEEEGRKYFLLYLRPIINGTGNYYIESRTRELRRTDVIIDYHGERYVIEMKIWHGREYNNRGEKQLIEYLDDYHIDVGYMISFNFNKKKQIGVREIMVGNKKLIEAIV